MKKMSAAQEVLKNLKVFNKVDHEQWVQPITVAEIKRCRTSMENSRDLIRQRALLTGTKTMYDTSSKKTIDRQAKERVSSKEDKTLEMPPKPEGEPTNVDTKLDPPMGVQNTTVISRYKKPKVLRGKAHGKTPKIKKGLCG